MIKYAPIRSLSELGKFAESVCYTRAFHENSQALDSAEQTAYWFKTVDYYVAHDQMNDTSGPLLAASEIRNVARSFRSSGLQTLDDVQKLRLIEEQFGMAERLKKSRLLITSMIANSNEMLDSLIRDYPMRDSAAIPAGSLHQRINDLRLRRSAIMRNWGITEVDLQSYKNRKITL